MNTTQCKIADCLKPVKRQSHIYCPMHNERIKKTGSPYKFCAKCGNRLPTYPVRKSVCEECFKCRIDGCERPSQGRGLCKMHWSRWKKHGDPLKSLHPSEYNIKQNCTVDGCTRPYHTKGYCSYHGYRVRKYGNPLAQGSGRNTGRSRMETPSYSGMHKRLFYDRGKASQFKCADCGRQAEEWSYSGGDKNEQWDKVRGSWVAYSTDQSLYAPRCKRCHRKRDDSLTREHDVKGRFAKTPESIRPADGSQPIRAIDDALTTAGIITDDSTITAITALKRRAKKDEPPGAHITLTPLGENNPH